MDLSLLRNHLGEKQIQALAHSQAKVNLLEGAVRSGKTVAANLRWLMHCADPPPGGELIMIGKTARTLYTNVLAPLMNSDITGPFARYVEHTPGSVTATIMGRLVHLIGANDARAEAKIRGITASGIYIDEASLLPNEEFYEQCLARLSPTGSKLFMTSNPDAPAHWLRKSVILANDPAVRTWHFVIDDNPFLDAEYVATLKRLYSGLFYKRFILGQWVSGSGSVLDMWDEDRHVVDVLPTIREWISVGIDYGTVNPFAAVLLGLGMDRRLYAVSEYRYDSKKTGQQLTDAEYSERFRTWLTQVPIPHSSAKGVRPRYTIVDPSAASFKLQLHRDGLTVTDGDNAVMDGLREMSSLLATDRLKVHRSCQALIDEVPAYSWDDRAALLGEDKVVKTEDHSIDALRYSTFTTRRIWRSELRAA